MIRNAGGRRDKIAGLFSTIYLLMFGPIKSADKNTLRLTIQASRVTFSIKYAFSKPSCITE